VYRAQQASLERGAYVHIDLDGLLRCNMSWSHMSVATSLDPTPTPHTRAALIGTGSAFMRVHFGLRAHFGLLLE